jgi:hypothetical protein
VQALGDVTLSTIQTRNNSQNWRSDPGKHMFGLVNRRFIRTLIYVLVAGQVLLSAPIASAIGNSASAATTEMPCADSMPQADESNPCPCCPEGTSGVAACLSACTASVAALPTIAVQPQPTPAVPAPALAFLPAADLSEPPLKPPPIA